MTSEPSHPVHNIPSTFSPLEDNNTYPLRGSVEIQQEDPSENYAPTLGWSLKLFLGGSLFLDDE
jgi:hypothetical protein